MKYLLVFCINLLMFCSQVWASKINAPFKPVHKEAKTFKNLQNINGQFTDKKGFLIVTTNDLTHQLKNLQKYIDVKANHRKFNVFLATEKDYDQKSAKNVQAAMNRGEPFGRIRQFQLINFLKSKYQKLNLKYVLFIGHAHPQYGDVPMVTVGRNQNATKPNEASTHHANHSPSDYPYTDLDTEWDLDGDGYFEDHRSAKGYIKSKKVTTTREPEIFVGRVPFDGE